MATRTGTRRAAIKMLTDLDAQADVFRALSEPIRLQILSEIAQAPEWPCTALDEALPVAKSTISHHVKILRQVGLVEVRKDGRYYHYRLRRDVLEEVAPGLAAQLDAGA